MQQTAEPMHGDGDYDRLEKRYTELAGLAGSLAHEIKNPLSVIRMNIDLLAEELQEEASSPARRARNKLEIVNQQCTRLENLLNDFLRFAGVRDLDLHHGSLNAVVEQVLSLFEPQASEMHVEVARFLDPDLPHMRLDAEKLHAAILNLVKNALESMPEGGQLTLRTYSTPRGIAVDLIDTGTGMNNETMSNVFREFYSTKQGGSGLGLPTAAKIVEAHGGRISVQSDVGRGTKFTLEFPTPARLA